MLKRTSIFLNPEHMKLLSTLGKVRGLKPAQITRIAIDEYLRRAARQAAAEK